MRTFAVRTGARFVFATSHVTVSADPPRYFSDPSFGDVTRNGQAFGARMRVVAAVFTPPPSGRPSRAVRRKCNEGGFALTRGVPTYADVGRNSEKHFTSASGQVPVSALVSLARICARSGKMRVGSAPGRFSPGDAYCCPAASLTSAAVSNWRKRGPFVF